MTEKPTIYQDNLKHQNKGQWHGPVNKLVSIFYERANTEIHNGELILRATPNILADISLTNFTDKEFSKDTIETILRPGRPDKRSPDHKKYKFPSN